MLNKTKGVLSNIQTVKMQKSLMTDSFDEHLDNSRQLILSTHQNQKVVHYCVSDL